MIKKSIFFRVFLTVILLAYLILKLNLRNLAEIINKSNLIFFVLSIILSFIMVLIRIIRWKCMLNSVEIRAKFSTISKIYLIGMFYGLISPGKIGELGKTYYFSERVKAFTTSILEKFLDILILFILSMMAMILILKNSNSISTVTIHIIATFWVLVSIMIVLILLINTSKYTKYINKVLILFKITGNSEDFILSLNKIIKNPKTFTKILMLTILYYSIMYIASYVLLNTICVTTDVKIIFSIPLIVLIGNIPISISGIGLRESIGMLIFESLGKSGSAGFIFSFLSFVCFTLLPGLTGYILSMGGNKWIRK